MRPAPALFRWTRSRQPGVSARSRAMSRSARPEAAVIVPGNSRRAEVSSRSYRPLSSETAARASFA